MALLTWIAAGSALLFAILVLSLWLNRKKRTARLAVRLAEAYRSVGCFDAAVRLYGIPGELDQNIPEARKGRQLAEQGRREPVIEPGLVEGALELLRDQREHLARYFEDRELDVDLPDPGPPD